MSNPSAVRRVLVMLPLAPRLDATNGSSRAMAQFLAGLAARHRVALIYLRAADEPALDNILQERCEIVEEVLRPGHGSSLIRRVEHGIRLITKMLQGQPMWVTDWHTKAYYTRLNNIVQSWKPDLIQLDYHMMGQYLPALKTYSAPRVLIEHEPGIQSAPYLEHAHGIISRLLNYPDKLAWQWFERAIIKQVQAVVVFTEGDRQALAPLAGQTRIVQIPIGTVLQSLRLNPLGCSPPGLVFVGNFKHAPNIDAAERLIQVILPQVQVRHPEVTLHIVGDQPPPRIKHLASDKVIITGRVPDVTPYLDRAALVVVPLRLGGGMRVKVLEALAAGKATVASPLAVEGLNVTHGDQIIVANNDQQFSNEISQLLVNPERRASLAERAHTWAQANLGWEKSIEAHEALYQRLIEGSNPAGLQL